LKGVLEFDFALDLGVRLGDYELSHGVTLPSFRALRST
jgi:hypothetical protein